MKRENLKLLSYLVKMESRGRGRRGRSRGNSRPPPVFYHQVFVEAMGAAAAAIAHASTARGQGGPNNLQRFMAYHPLVFRG